MRRDGSEEAESCAMMMRQFSARQPLQQQLEAMQAEFEALGAHWSALKRRVKPRGRGIAPKAGCPFRNLPGHSRLTFSLVFCLYDVLIVGAMVDFLNRSGFSVLLI